MIHAARPATGPLRGTIRVPGDKSISHRSVLFAAMSEGTSRLSAVLDSDDVRSTMDAARKLGAVVGVTDESPAGLDITVTGWGGRGPLQPDVAIDCGNSGTTCRLLMGVLAGWPLHVTLEGDASLRSRPMRRVMDPLSTMGAAFDSDDGRLPVTVHGARLQPIAYDSPVASAQVTTCLLLAGLRASGCTSVTEPALSRDHTARLLPAFGVDVAHDVDGLTMSVCGPATLTASDVAVPADPSSAAFMAAAAALVPGSDVVIADVSLNPTRLGFVEVLKRMGADVTVTESRLEGAEPVGDIRVRYVAGLTATVVIEPDVPSLIDEIPVLAVVAASATGTTRFEGVRELRVKESDRLEAVAEGLTKLGVTVRTGDDWLEVDGPARLRAATLSSLGDHRLAMSWAVAALGAEGPVEIDAWEAVAVSYPRFAEDLGALVS